MSPTVFPTAPQELEEMLSDQSKVQDLIKNGQIGDFIKNYVVAMRDKDHDISAQIREQSQAVLAEMLGTDRKNVARNAHVGPDQAFGKRSMRNALYNKAAPGAKVDHLYNGTADFFQSIWHHAAALPNAGDILDRQAKASQIKNSFGSTVPADGGFLVPEEIRSELLTVSLQSAVVRSRARTIPMSSLRVPIPMVDCTTNNGSVFGGIVCYWTEEGASLTESQTAFGRVVLEAKKLTGYAEAPNELIADAPAFGAYLDQTFPEAMAWYEDLAFTSGTGVGEPLGYLNVGNTAAVSVTAETGQAVDTIVWENVAKMYARMLPSSLARAVWVASPDTFPELATMALSVGTGGSAVWLNNGADGPPMTILGRPVIFDEKAGKLGDAGDLNFVDFGYYLIGDRMTMQASSSPHYKFAADKTAYRIVSRVDGQPWLKSAITPANGATTTLSPFVKIAAR